MTHPTSAELAGRESLLRELARVKAIFQLRAIKAVIGDGAVRSQDVPGNQNGKNFPEKGKDFP